MASASADPPAGTVDQAAAPAAETTPQYRWWVLAVIGVAQLTVVLDATIVNIALPSAQRDLGFSDSGRQWVVTAYSLAFGSLLLLGGRIADLFGRKITFVVGLFGFAGASALGGAANGFEMLIIARAAQGLFGALLAPAALSLLVTTFTEGRERARAFGVYGAIAGAGGAVGLLLGGVLTEHLNWRWTLYVNLLFAAIAIVGALLLLRTTERDRSATLDLPGTLLASAGLFCVVFGFSNADTHGWDSPGTWGCLTAAPLLLGAFTWSQARAERPLLPLRVLLDRDRGASFLMILIGGGGLFAVFLFLTYYLQQSLGYTPVETGLAFLPLIGTLMVTAAIATSVLMRLVGPKLLVPTGMGIAAVGLAWMTVLDLDSSYASEIMPTLLVTGVGIGLVFAPTMNLATLGVAAEDSGVASAAVNIMQQIGGSISIALLNTLAADTLDDYLSTRDRNDSSVLAHAALESYRVTYWWAAGFFAAGTVISALLYRRGIPDQNQGATPVHM
ncbi:MFS transporter [Streptomyces sp. B1866]|uniref:MFS transporter n=1 Tax=Streptomyces sp. B1866 TaxID=3075431 RepID=UPI00288D0030|nr:MFS transporter [Streptomyces sp. B1866]MDT3397218.1 MFS transporter [Streptomyces sp. B1866]